jgi:hypothetical protein
MKTIITLELDAELVQEANRLAAEEGTSVSGLLSGKLEELVTKRRNYDQARQRALARLERGYELNWTPPRSRDELHER